MIRPGALRRRARRRRATPRAGSAHGFTLLEVMLALALLGMALTVLIKSAAGNIFNAQQAHMMGVVTDLARGKMYDLEEKLLKDGFTDTEQHEEDLTFSDEGWPSIHYSYKIELVELPAWEQLQKLAQGQGSGAGSGSAVKHGSGASSAGASSAGASSAGASSDSGDSSDGVPAGFGASVLGGFMSQIGGLAGFGGGGIGSLSGTGKGNADIASGLGASFVQSQYTMFQQILKDSIRRVTLTVTWQIMGSARDMKVSAFFSDAGAMDKVLNGLGSQELGSGAGSGTGGGTPVPPKTPGAP